MCLVLSCDPDAPRLAETRTPRPNRDPAGTIVEWLRAAARGRRLDALNLDPADRVVRLGIAEGQLILELTGRAANLVALDEDGRVVALARRSPRIRVGQPYAPPSPPPARTDVDDGRTGLEIEGDALGVLEKRAAARTATARARLLRQARKRWSRLWDRVSEDLRRSAKAEEHRRFGELLKSQLHLVERGATEVWVVDWYAEGTPKVRIELDPTCDGPANVAQLFRRYRKASAGAERASTRLAEVEVVGRQLDALTGDEGEIENLREALVRLGLLPRPPVERAVKGKGPVRLPYRVFHADNGERILVGRGGADNHQTTFRVARGNDHWFHVRDAPGAHVVVPLPARGLEPHPETLLDAAALAVHHSDLRGEAVVDVTHTRRKHVQPVKGGPAGRVRVAKAKSMTVSDGPRRIERLYAARNR